ncbi:MAG: tetratricopeptide repeat protein [bacterium]
MNNFEHQLRKATQFEKEGKYLHAIQIYLQMFELPEYKRSATLRLASIYDKLNNFQSSVSIIEKYLDEEPHDDEIRKFFAQILIRNFHYDKALDVLSALPRTEHNDIFYLMGVSNFHLMNFEIAKINFEDFIAKNKTSELVPESYLYIAKANIELGNLDEALRSAKSSEWFLNRNHELYLTLATIYYYKEMYFHAHESILKSLKLNPKEPGIKSMAGKILFRMGEFEKAEKYLREYVEVENSDSDIYSLLGKVCLKNNKKKDAESFFSIALELDPHNSAAKEGKNLC